MSKKTILLVDDDEVIVEEFESLFIDEGYNVVTANNGKVGLEKFAEGNIDFILTDLKMPVMDGVEFIKQVKSEGHTVPTILMTGYSDYSEAELLSIGVSAVLFKPFDIDLLIETVSDLINV